MVLSLRSLKVPGAVEVTGGSELYADLVGSAFCEEVVSGGDGGTFLDYDYLYAGSVGGGEVNLFLHHLR